LLAEDNPVNQEVAFAMLEALGCRVEVVTNGQEAITAVTRATYDLVLMDCKMPELDGFAATREIRTWERTTAVAHEAAQGNQQPPHPPLPIIAITANAVAGERERCLAAGMNDYLSKPFTQAQLYAVLERWCPRQQNQDDGRVEAPTQSNGALLPQVPSLVQPVLLPTLDDTVLGSIRALEQKRGTMNLLQRLITQYFSRAPQLLQTIKASLLRGDAAGVHMAAHSLKSSSATLGALPLATLCGTLEALGQSEQLTDANAIFARIEAEYARVRVALAAEHARQASQ
jgi:CheY-like chemotaxis protein/HPt (histidine-containing phosphotransfer) domain-containing protein